MFIESMWFLKSHRSSMHTRNSSFINENLEKYWVYSIFKCIHDNDMYVLKLEHVQENECTTSSATRVLKVV